MNTEIIKLSLVEKQIGDMETIADLVSEHMLQACFKFSGYIAFITYDEFYQDTIHSIEAVENEIFIADTFNNNLSEIISGTDTIYKTVGAIRALNKLPPDKTYTHTIRSGWVFLERNAVAIEQMKLALKREGVLSGLDLFDQNNISLYELKLTQKNLFISQTSLSNYLSSIAKSIPPITSHISSISKNDGVLKEKRLADERLIHIAKLTWKNEINLGIKKTKLLAMATAIRHYLFRNERHIYEQTTSDEAVKELIRCAAPSYAKLGGKPPKSDILITVIADE